MPNTWAIKLGAVSTSKRNLARGVEAGLSIVVSQITTEDGGHSVGHIKLFRERGDADRAALLLIEDAQTQSVFIDV